MRNKFSWEHFDTQFLQAILFSEKTKKSSRPPYKTDEKDLLIPFMDMVCEKPNEKFVQRYRNEISDYFFADSTHLVNIMRALEKRKYKGAKVGSMEEMQERFKKMRFTSTVMTFILKELYEQGLKQIIDDDDISIFTMPKTIDLTACIADDLPMYPYQNEAIDRLKNYFLSKNKRAGILAMPTGSGKTRIATKFLVEDMIANGWQIIWLTHRAMLIEQAAASFYTYAGSILRKATPQKDIFKMVCVSGTHASVRATEKDDDLMIFSVQSLVRNLPFLQAVLKENVMIVVDEAHHALAPSYRAVIQEIQKIGRNVKLLGLTATPKRISNADTWHLMKIFDHHIIHSVPLSVLITRGFLSSPIFERINTNVDFNTTITLDEQKYIRKWGELSPETMEKMASVAERNALITDTYVKNKERYGKTLIFALNATHCISLCEELQKRGIRCDYIYSAHPGNNEKISRFKNGELDVLVNINVMTEGNDVPDIQTVFLTRPTASDVLLMQMIGRGMRGVGSGGTETVNIVDFHDVWGTFAHWMNPEYLIEIEPEKDESVDQTPQHHKKTEMLPWEMVRDLLDGIQISMASNSLLTSNSSMPAGWIDVVDEEGNDTKVLVFESQLAGYKAMRQDKERVLNDLNFTGTMAQVEYFNSFGLVPSSKELQMVIEVYRMTEEFPHIYSFPQRKSVDAANIAQKLKDENVGIADLSNRILGIYQNYNEVIDSLYGSKDIFERRILDFIHYPNGLKPLGMKVEEIQEEMLTLDRTPAYDIQELTAEVIKEMFDDNYGRIPPIRWTDKAYASYFGVYRYWEDQDCIQINAVLNAKGVPREVVKYVIYHELLHRDNHKHDKAFRMLEHEYPNWTECERFLDFTFPKFNLEYAM